ncbi:MAG: nuclear transport factor 2 family protein [Balneola sp.]|nr:nuclear transport factor 2 family protein [Balneola sp.]MBO6649481.1 nuclear transport factor 2 family protein [Balneola sp.]MBO6711297.1 nuclear transport factor 2 family protein [Balneola sp.]MBO6800588.1 nuclear transport factor 2 family protein [Balneola sp.]MBO6869233.1 nuclear transport factor 2 family protein [Balneola sp.]
MRKFTYTLLMLFISSIALVAQETNDKEMIAKTLNDLETAIVENDSEKAGEILHDDVTILEGGGMETKSEYLSHHFHSDGKFLSAMNREELSQEISVEGNMAWVTSKTKMTGTYSGRDIDLSSLELAVLKKENGMWKVIALHWSSR